MLKVNNIHVNYGHFEALRGISLEVNEGEMVALLGANGAGKSTTINAVSGMVNVTQGSIEYMGEDITHMPVYERVAKGIVQVPEGRKLFPMLSVEDNLIIGSYLPEARAARAKNLEYCYSLFPKLYERRSQMASTLSGGEQQMCAIARALMENPKILMLDEPSLGLAPVIVQEIFDALEGLRQSGLTIFIVEQNVMATLDIVDRAYLIEIGENVMNGKSDELLADKKLREAYLGI